MKLDLEKLDEYVERNALRNDYELAKELGIRQFLIHAARKKLRIGYDEVRNFYNRNGEELTENLINFEEETLDGFKAKYIQIGNKLC